MFVQRKVKISIFSSIRKKQTLLCIPATREFKNSNVFKKKKWKHCVVLNFVTTTPRYEVEKLLKVIDRSFVNTICFFLLKASAVFSVKLFLVFGERLVFSNIVDHHHQKTEIFQIYRWISYEKIFFKMLAFFFFLRKQTQHNVFFVPISLYAFAASYHFWFCKISKNFGVQINLVFSKINIIKRTMTESSFANL